jgi:hypothetical protein
VGGYGQSIETDNRAGIDEWHRQNDALKVLEPSVDMLFPSGYTLVKDKRAWIKQVRATVCEARRLSKKPVYVFIWPEFHEGSVYKNTPVPADLWADELDTLVEIADGMVIWGGWDFPKNKLKTWDESEAWWQVTKGRLAKWQRYGRPRPKAR